MGLPSGAVPAGCSVASTIRLFLTPNTASDARYWSPRRRYAWSGYGAPGRRPRNAGVRASSGCGRRLATDRRPVRRRESDRARVARTRSGRRLRRAARRVDWFNQRRYSTHGTPALRRPAVSPGSCNATRPRCDTHRRPAVIRGDAKRRPCHRRRLELEPSAVPAPTWAGLIVSGTTMVSCRTFEASAIAPGCGKLTASVSRRHPRAHNRDRHVLHLRRNPRGRCRPSSG